MLSWIRMRETVILLRRPLLHVTKRACFMGWSVKYTMHIHAVRLFVRWFSALTPHARRKRDEPGLCIRSNYRVDIPSLAVVESSATVVVATHWKVGYRKYPVLQLLLWIFTKVSVLRVDLVSEQFKNHLPYQQITLFLFLNLTYIIMKFPQTW